MRTRISALPIPIESVRPPPQADGGLFSALSPTVQSQIDDAEQAASAAQNAATAAEATAQQASADAQAASTVAGDAKTAAERAETVATNAAQLAVTAEGIDQTAQGTAMNAQGQVTQLSTTVQTNANSTTATFQRIGLAGGQKGIVKTDIDGVTVSKYKC